MDRPPRCWLPLGLKRKMKLVMLKDFRKKKRLKGEPNGKESE